MRAVGRYAGVLFIIMISGSCGLVIGMALAVGQQTGRPGRVLIPRLPHPRTGRPPKPVSATLHYPEGVLA
jgi:hypothetical protein